MTNENKIEIKETKTCLCQSEWFRKFLLKTLAVFVGTFCALSLFSALHKPKMPPCPYGKMMMRPPIHHMHHYRGPAKFEHHRQFKKQEFQKNFESKDLNKKV